MYCPYDPNTVCTGPGDGQRWWTCPVTGASLTREWTTLCASKPRYYLAWFEGRGPRQVRPEKGGRKIRRGPAQPRRRKLLGDHVEVMLSRVGITQERVGKWLGKEGGCAGCDRRKKWLNKLHLWAENFMGKSAEVARDALQQLFDEKDKPRPSKAERRRRGRSRSRRRRGKGRAT